MTYINASHSKKPSAGAVYPCRLPLPSPLPSTVAVCLCRLPLPSICRRLCRLPLPSIFAVSVAVIFAVCLCHLPLLGFCNSSPLEKLQTEIMGRDGRELHYTTLRHTTLHHTTPHHTTLHYTTPHIRNNEHIVITVQSNQSIKKSMTVSQAPPTKLYTPPILTSQTALRPLEKVQSGIKQCTSVQRINIS